MSAELPGQYPYTRGIYPEMYRAYQKACDAKDVQLGQVQVFDLGGLAGGPRWLINFPTKGHWKARSRLAGYQPQLSARSRSYRFSWRRWSGDNDSGAEGS